jgi:peptide/nickel transport system permease protein
MSSATEVLVVEDQIPPARRRANRWRILGSDWSFRIGAGVILVYLLAAVFAPVIAPYDPLSLHPPLRPWFSEYLLGTDSLGRDVLSMLIYGARVSLLFAFGAAGLSLMLGIVLGAVPAYIGGWVDDTSARVYEIILMIPQLFLIIAIVVFTGGNVYVVVIVIGATIWPTNAKIMRSQVLSVKKRLFVEAARASGRSPMSILFRHVVPNAIGPVIANSTLQMAHAVLTEAGLSFLGLSDPNRPSWGVLLNEGQSYISSGPWMVVPPGIALVVLLLALHLVGEGVSHAVDPRTKGAS